MSMNGKNWTDSYYKIKEILQKEKNNLKESFENINTAEKLLDKMVSDKIDYDIRGNK